MADIQHAIQIAAQPAAVYPLVATGDGFGQWWATDITNSEGRVELGFFNRSTVYRLELVDGNPPHRAEWICDTGKEWSGTRIIFRLEAGGPGTVLRFTHKDWESATDYFVSCNTTWGELMFRLKAAAEGKKPGPLFLANGMASPTRLKRSARGNGRRASPWRPSARWLSGLSAWLSPTHSRSKHSPSSSGARRGRELLPFRTPSGSPRRLSTFSIP
jgi:uncharacterized protein YndB with AHSA1/START domain